MHLCAHLAAHFSWLSWNNPIPSKILHFLKKVNFRKSKEKESGKAPNSPCYIRQKKTPKGNKTNCLRHLYDLFYQPKIFPQESNLMLNDACQDKKKFIFLASCSANLVDWKPANQSTTDLFTSPVSMGEGERINKV